MLLIVITVLCVFRLFDCYMVPISMRHHGNQQRNPGMIMQSIAIFRKGPFTAYLNMASFMLRMVMTESYYNPDISTPTWRTFKNDRQPVANPSPTSRRPIAAHLRSIRVQSPTNRQPVPDWSLIWSPIFIDILANRSPTGRRLIADRSPIDCWVTCNWKTCELDHTMVAKVADFFFGRKTIASRLQCMCYCGLMS